MWFCGGDTGRREGAEGGGAASQAPGTLQAGGLGFHPRSNGRAPEGSHPGNTIGSMLCRGAAFWGLRAHRSCIQVRTEVGPPGGRHRPRGTPQLVATLGQLARIP